MNPRITLEQWQALVAVVDAGGYAQAAERLHKSQSSVTYLVQKLESLLDVKVFEIKGRKAALTPAGADLFLGVPRRLPRDPRLHAPGRRRHPRPAAPSPPAPR